MSPGPLALVGSGEFLPAMRAVDDGLLAGRPRRVAVIPTAAGPEGDASIARWFRMAHEHYGALDAEVIEVDVRARSDAQAWGSDGAAEALRSCGLVYLSGGNPAFLADTVRGTPLAEAIESAWRSGAGLAGCSAGAMALGRQTLSVRGGTVDGLGLAGGITTIPHFDRMGFARRLAGMVAQLVTDGQTVVGVDEETAVVWSAETGEWQSSGVGRTWILDGTGGRGDGYADGAAVPLPGL